MPRVRRPTNGRISVQTPELIDQLLSDNENYVRSKEFNLKHRRAASAGTTGRPHSTADRTGKYDLKSQGSEQTFKIQNWLNEKSVRNIQEKTDFESKSTRNMYQTLLENEDTFVKEVDDFLSENAMLDRRKKQMLFKKWDERVYSPVREKIDGQMNGPSYKNLDRRKRQIYDKYLEYSNKKGVVFLDVMSPEEYDPLVLNANRPSPLVAKTSPIDDPLLMQGKRWLDEDRTAIRCITGEEIADRDIERLHIPPSPLVPLGRHGTKCSTWLRMQLHDINSGVRKRSGLRMKGIYNDTDVDFEEWSKTRTNPKLVDTELRAQKKRQYKAKHSTTIELEWPVLPDISNTTYTARIPNVLPLASSFQNYPELQHALSASF